MLVLKKLNYDAANNISINITHGKYNINVKSKLVDIDAISALRTLQDYGRLYNVKANHPGFCNTKEFNSRCYKLKNYNLAGEGYSWFIADTFGGIVKHEDKILKLLNRQYQHYDITVSVLLHTICLAYINNLDDDYDFSSVLYNCNKKDLIETINSMIAEVFPHAIDNERTIFRGYSMGNAGTNNRI